MSRRSGGKSQRALLCNGMLHLALLAGALVMVAPLLWALSTSLKTLGQALAYPPKLLPDPVVWQNYRDVLADQRLPFGRFFVNSLFVASAETLGRLLVCSMGAYAFARLKFRGRDTLFLLYLGTLMIPSQVTLVPLFVLMTKLHWVNTYWALILPGLGSAFGTFLLRQYFLTIPESLEEAAIIDGCSRFRAYWRIILPLSKPALATLAVFSFMQAWNEFLWPLIVIGDVPKMTLSLGLSGFQTEFQTQYHKLMAGAMISTLPVLMVFLFAQKQFVRGLATAGLKE